MAAVTTTDGVTVMADLFFLGTNPDAGATLQLALFQNSGLTEAQLRALTVGTLVEPTGGGYSRKTLVRANFTRAAGVTGYAQQTFQPTGAVTWAIAGYCVISTGTTERILFIEQDPAAPVSILTASDAYKVTLNDTVS